MKTVKRALPWIVSGCLFLQGLYFTHMALAMLMITALLLFAVIVMKKSIMIPRDKGFMFFILFFVCHLAGYLTFLEKGMLVFDLYRSLSYVVFYLLIYQIHDETVENEFKKAFVITVAAGGIISVLSYLFGIMPQLQYVIKGRLAGPLQYANTNAIILLAALLVLIYMKMNRYVKAAAMVALMLPMLLTMSRSTITIALVMLVIYCIVERPGAETYLQLISSIGISLLTVALLDQGGSLERLQGTSLQVSEWQTRLLYYKDALGLVRDRLQGYGPYGYYYVQRAFQTGSTYYVKYVHSSLLQILLDLGLMAGILFAAFGLYVVLFRRFTMANRLVIMVLLGHSLIDIDLAFSWVWLLIIFFMQDGAQRSFKNVTIGSGMKALLTVTGFAVILSSGYLMVSELYHMDRDYGNAYSIYPYHTEAMRHHLGRMEDKAEEVALAERLLERHPYILKAHEVMFNQYYLKKDYDMALYHARELVRLNVLNIRRYELLSGVLRKKGEQHLLEEDMDTARECFEEILEMPETLEQLAKEKNTIYNVKHVPALTMTKELIGDYLVASQWMTDYME